MSHPTTQLWFGLLTRRERWGLSVRGWLIAAGLAALAAWVFALQAYPFLATTERLPAQVLVVEGWVHEYAIRAAVDEFNRGGYQRIVTTGGPVEGLGGYTNDYGTCANVAAGRIRLAGVRPELVAMAPSRVADRNRTFGSAVALAAWLKKNAPAVSRVNVLTADVHARRTRLLFQTALGDRVEVGVISVPSPDFDARHWWRYSEGVRSVLGEMVSYLYARLWCLQSSTQQPDLLR